MGVTQKVVGWWEEYKCGCVSETVKFKKDLCGYCGRHGNGRRYIYPEVVAVNKRPKKA